MEDDAEQAFILYCAVAGSLIIAGAIISGFAGTRLIKALGAVLFLLGCLAAVRYDQALQWLFVKGMFKYLP